MRKDLPQTPEEMMAHFAPGFTAEEIETMRENLFCESEYAFVEDRECRDLAWCSHCQEYIHIGKCIHHDIIQCPLCGETLMVVHPWRSINFSDEGLIYFFRRSILDETVITGLAVAVRRLWYEAKGGLPHEVTEEMTVDTYYLWKSGAGGVACGFTDGRKAWNNHVEGVAMHPVGSRDGLYTGGYMGNFPFYQPPHGGRPKSARNAECNWHGGKIFVDTEGLDEAVAQSPLRYVVDAYDVPHNAGGYVTKFLDFAARWPAVEIVIKMGLRNILDDKIVRKYPSLGVINWRGRTLEKIFKGRLTKADKAYMRNSNVTEGGLKLWQTFHGELPLEDAETLSHARVSLEGVRDLIDIKSACKWLRRRGDMLLAGDYFDYILDCAQLGMDLKDKSVLHPKDIGRAHQNTIRQITYRKNELLEKAYQRRRRKLEQKYSFSADGFMVVVPKSTMDLIDEGKAMHNCVGGYIKNVSRGMTDVVFVRRESAPEESYITMEVRDGRIIQARAQYNKSPDEEGLAFVELFRKERLNGKHDRGKRRTA